MSEIAEMMLDGTLCEGCGDFMGDTSGYARRCRSCATTPSERGVGTDGFVQLGDKMNRLLERVLHATDTLGDGSLYRGMRMDYASAKLTRLFGHGYIEIFAPGNPAHKDRAIITERGRAYLRSLNA